MSQSTAGVYTYPLCKAIVKDVQKYLKANGRASL